MWQVPDCADATQGRACGRPSTIPRLVYIGERVSVSTSAMLASHSEMIEHSVVVRILADSPAGLCLQCIARVAGATLQQAEKETTELVYALRVVPTIGQCAVCAAARTVYPLG